jgi:hypothetical protein
MNTPQNRPRLSSRITTVAGITALVAVALAARSQGGQQPPVAPDSVPPVAAVDSMAPQDSTVIDSMATSDSTIVMTAMITPAPAPISTTWPVDPVTGQTIINGEPVVGQVFIMQKTDGVVKYANEKVIFNNEPMSPEAPIVGTTNAVPALEHTRRHRGIMVQATEWAIDGKRSARERHYYRPATTGSALGQQP